MRPDRRRTPCLHGVGTPGGCIRRRSPISRTHTFRRSILSRPEWAPAQVRGGVDAAELLQCRTFRDQIRTRSVFHVKHDHVGTGRQYSSPTQCPGTRSRGDPPGLDVVSLGPPVGVLALDAVGFRQCRSGAKGCRYGLTQVLVGSRSARGRRLPVVFHKRRDQNPRAVGNKSSVDGGRGWLH